MLELPKKGRVTARTIEWEWQLLLGAGTMFYHFSSDISMSVD
jgi:hypothetical protein